jgi:hypothetical protein
MRIDRASTALFLLCLSGCEPPGPGLELRAEPGLASEYCCGGIGLCVPQGYVSEETAARLGQADCQTDTLWCVPLRWLEDPSSGPEPCRAAGDLEGRCLPSCLPELEPRAPQLSQESCATGQLCVPCYDPSTGEDTEACRFDADPGPSEPPPS